MFLLLRYAFSKVFRVSKDRNVCILGLDDSGKSSLLNHIRFQFDQPHVQSSEMVPTVGLNYTKIEFNGIKWTFWDLGGTESMRGIWKSYFQDIDLLIWVFDSSEKARFEESVREFSKIIKDDKMIHAPIAMLANKQDKKGVISEKESRELFMSDELSSRPTQVFLTCFAGDFEKHSGLQPLFDWMTHVIKTDPESRQRTVWRKSVTEAEQDEKL